MAAYGKLVALVVGVALGAACTTDSPGDRSPGLFTGDGTGDAGCAIVEAPLVADGAATVGELAVANDDSRLGLRVTTTGDWVIHQANAYAGADPAPTMPDGTPAPALFPHHRDFTGAPGRATTFFVDLADLGAACGVPLTIAVHAEVLRVVDGVVVDGSAAWALGAGDGSWSLAYDLCCPSGCTLTQGYWKNHEESWPTDHLDLGSTTYDQGELLALLRTPPRGDASIILAHQLIAARLNRSAGAVSPDLAGAIADAGAWMDRYADGDGRLPYRVAAGSAAGTQGTAISDRLEGLNEGHGDLPHCDDGASITPGPDTGTR